MLIDHLTIQQYNFQAFFGGLTDKKYFILGIFSVLWVTANFKLTPVYDWITHCRCRGILKVSGT